MLGGKLPVDELPPALDVRRAVVALVNVVGMLPDVAGKEGGLALGEGASSIVGGLNGEVVVLITNEPSPARTEMVGSLLGELGLEGSKRAPGLVDGLEKLSGGFASAVGRQGLPVESMVPDLCRHVEDLALLGANNLLQRLRGHRGTLRHLVELGHIAAVVLLVVKLDSLGRDVRSKGVLLVREGG